MRMHSDLGKMYRRNYMVKSQLNSLEAKSRALNEKIGDETKIDEWAESYITRADAQIDDVHDYMNFRNIASLGHMRMKPTPTQALPAPKLPIYGQQRIPADTVPTRVPTKRKEADSDGDGVPNSKDKCEGSDDKLDSDGDGTPDDCDDDFGRLGWTEALPQVGIMNTIGAVTALTLMGVTYGIISYDEYKNKGNIRAMLKPRLRNAAFYGAIGAGIAVAYQGVVGTGQWSGGW